MRLRFLFSLCLFIPILLAAQSLKTPQEYFGFRMGTDKNLIDWSQIDAYFNYLDRNSDKIKVAELGKSTQGRPFLAAFFSSAENLKNLDTYQAIQKKLAYPFDVDKARAAQLVKDGKLVMLLSLNIHSTEIASSQESVELAYDLITRTDTQVKEILDNVILIMIPSLNPDGQDMVTKWYRQHLGTASEGSRMPKLYHYYAGHDNNRDWFMFNLKETQLVAPLLYRRWFPEIVYDQHQMGSSGPRMFLPPYKDPINPNVSSVLLSEVNMLGKYMTSEMTEQGFSGIVNGMMFNSYFEGTMSKTPLWHNMIGILSELASVRIATPLYFPRGSLGKYGAEIGRYARGAEFLNPWPGGWWHLRDIIEYEKAAAFSMLGFAVRFKEKIMTNFYTLNKQNIVKGQNSAPFQAVIPAKQHDPNAAALMLQRLRMGGVKIYRAEADFTYRDKQYSRGSYVIPLAQPARSYIKDLFEVQKYPDLFEYPGGPPSRPYDFTGWTLPLQMGVKAFLSEENIEVQLSESSNFVFDVIPQTLAEAHYYLAEACYNNAFALVNELLKEDIPIYRTAQKGSSPGGTFVIKNQRGLQKKLSALSQKYRVPLKGSAENPAAKGWKLAQPRLAIYQPWRANIDEGWTRLVLDNFKFSYSVLHNRDIRSGRLHEKFDVILIPEISTAQLVEGKRNRSDEKKPAEPFIGAARMPKKFSGGIGKKGVQALKDFVTSGGTLITLGKACDFAIDKIRIPAVNVLKKKPRKAYFAPGALLEMQLDTNHPLAYGMEPKTAVRFTSSPAFRLLPHNQLSSAVGYFNEDNPLLSGWLIGAPLLAGRTVLAEISAAKGRVILFGFRVQSRAQTYGTFKLLFNAILRSTMMPQNKN